MENSKLIRIRVAQPEHLPDIRTLFQEYANSLGFDLDFQDFSKELATLPGEYAPPHGRLLLATVEGRMAGCVALRSLESNICEMKRLYVRPEFRGNNIGRALTKAIIRGAGEAGYSRIRLDTVPTMLEAQHLYESLGFKQIPHYRYNPVKRGKFMELLLGTKGR